MSKAPSHDVFTVREREGKKGFWLQIGSAWTNRDESFSVEMDAYPANGRLVIRARQAKEDSAEA